MKTKPCIDCGIPVDAEIHEEELGFCIPCQHAYFAEEDEAYWKSVERAK